MPGGSFLIWTWAIVLAVWLVGLLLAVAFAIVSRRVSLQGLLTEPLTGKMATVSRPQLLVVTLTGAVTFIATAVANIGGTNQFPDVPTWLLAVVGGSHVVYLGARTAAAALAKFSSSGGSQ
jgi:hypothetical protein